VSRAERLLDSCGPRCETIPETFPPLRSLEWHRWWNDAEKEKNKKKGKKEREEEKG
jgi:hypothetical protein